MDRNRPKKKYEVVRTDTLASQRAKHLAALWDSAHCFLVHPLTAMVVTITLAAIAASGRISMALSYVLLVIAFGQGCLGLRKSKIGLPSAIVSCVVLGIVLLGIAWWINSATEVPTNTDVMKGLGAIDRKLDEWLYGMGGDVIHVLEQEYNLGFVLIAFSGEVDATRVRPYTSRIHADWDKCKARINERGDVELGLPEWDITDDDGTRMCGSMFNLLFAASPYKTMPMTVGKIQIIGEYLQTKPFGHCVVLGFNRIL
jgi:hypothetical protein